MEKKSSAMSWLIIGAVCMLLIVAIGFFESNGTLSRYSDAHYFRLMILGGGGSLFLLIGIVKAALSKFKKPTGINN